MSGKQNEADGRCGTCKHSTYIGGSRKAPLCCHRFPPQVVREWFRLTEMYPATHEHATCGEYTPA